MGSVESVKPGGEKMRKAIRWISDTLLEHPEKTRREVIKEAEIRFDLSPKECAFLNANFDDRIVEN